MTILLTGVCAFILGACYGAWIMRWPKPARPAPGRYWIKGNVGEQLAHFDGEAWVGLATGMPLPWVQKRDVLRRHVAT